MTRRQRFGINEGSALASVALLVVFWTGTGIARAETDPFTSDKQQLVDRINQERAARDLKALARHAALDAAAQGHAEKMAAQNLFGHELDHTNPVDRAVAHGYPTRIIGETISWQSGLNPGETVNQWLASEVHRGILLGDYDDIGVGLARRPDGAYFWTVVVGRAHVASSVAPPGP